MMAAARTGGGLRVGTRSVEQRPDARRPEQTARGNEPAGVPAFVSKRPEGESGSSGGAFPPTARRRRATDSPAAVRQPGRVIVAEWYVVETQRHREAVARAVLAGRGVTSYLPCIAQWPRPAVGAAVGPLFPGYLFVHADLGAQAHRIMRSNGVKSFVAFGGAPVAVADAVVDFLREREGADGLVRIGAPEDVGGAAVRIVDGPFRGLTAVVTARLAAQDRVRVLMEILQRQTSVELPERWVRRL